ncbi:unnamed protein product [Closterium sp. Naga37s-1]|nr:unnamed protein product [Closterium sp. Naga37s-1]
MTLSIFSRSSAPGGTQGSTLLEITLELEMKLKNSDEFNLRGSLASMTVGKKLERMAQSVSIEDWKAFGLYQERKCVIMKEKGKEYSATEFILIDDSSLLGDVVADLQRAEEKWNRPVEKSLLYHRRFSSGESGNLRKDPVYLFLR